MSPLAEHEYYAHFVISKFFIYAALRIPEIWRYDGKLMRFYKLAGTTYKEISESRFIPGIQSGLVASALERSKKHGQTDALNEFRKQLRASRRK